MNRYLFDMDPKDFLPLRAHPETVHKSFTLQTHLLAAQVVFLLWEGPSYKGGDFLKASPAPHTLQAWAVCLYGSTNNISLLHIWIQISDPKATNSMFTMLRPALAQASLSDSFRQSQGSAFLIIPGRVLIPQH